MEKPASAQPIDLPPFHSASNKAEGQQRLVIEREVLEANSVEVEKQCEAEGEPMRPKVVRRKDWQLTLQAWDLLLKWLDGGIDSAGQRYEEARWRLIGYFDRNGCYIPEELADRTLEDVARRLQEEGWISCETPAQYCYTRAEYTLLEYRRELVKSTWDGGDALPGFGQRHPSHLGVDGDAEQEDKERLLVCLDRCLQRLKPDEGELIVQYYTGERGDKIENRKRLADLLDIPIETLRVRAGRIRARLEACINTCLKSQ